MKSMTYNKGNNRNIPFIPPIFPFAKSTGFRGKKGNNTYRLFPLPPAGSWGGQK